MAVVLPSPLWQARFNALGPGCISTLPQSERVLLFDPLVAVGLRLYLEGFPHPALRRFRLLCHRGVWKGESGGPCLPCSDCRRPPPLPPVG